ncbi:STE-like transcription factor [Ordospora colligata]|uniref:STE-like transcription factor n=1 Tax=Ordospora colligata OC4 TaxID=1354746 RepID=A0A0B2UIT9_9MICR|nr:STE-like transcription factor [Ordospora colligata OC4]KHN68967.1 STE-like transcription factor [Ordospora colligata OC4]TBU14001.1 STE-like transcription factor [Ordospora colligata]TBU14190.1 STE-like transcription factor [Ordospora colligata]TBU17859.1 STE-like transcription factor [Ordospora colligata]
MNTQSDKELFDFLANAPKEFRDGERIKKFQLKNGDYIHCVLWNMHFFVTGTDIVKILVWRFQNAGRCLASLKKFEEGVFSDLRNLKPGIDATLEGPRSEFLEFLYKNGCIRTQKKQKVFYWYSVPHDALFCDALERDLRRETNLFTYNKYINNLKRNSMLPHGVNGFGSHTRQNSKRVGVDTDSAYLRNMESRVMPMNIGYSKNESSDLAFEPQIYKAPNLSINPKNPSSVYDKQFEDIQRNGFMNQYAYSDFSIKDKLFSSNSQKLDYGSHRLEGLFCNDLFNNAVNESPKAASVNSLQPQCINTGSPLFSNRIPDEFPSLEDFDFISDRANDNEHISNLKSESAGQRISHDGVLLIPNTKGTLQK